VQGSIHGIRTCAEPVAVAWKGALTVITINRPEASNALNADAQAAMDAAFNAFAADDDRWVAIVTGAGVNAFRAGHISSSRQRELTGR
jgi:enoyl-CoA hydratase/carnithine racemase